MNKQISKYDKPIFIVGSPRSGTTLLQYMLRSHPEISLPTAESHFIIPFYQRRGEFENLDELPNLELLLEKIYLSRKRFFDEDLHGLKFDIKRFATKLHHKRVNSIPEIISSIFKENALGEGKSRWGDKTPYYILHLDTILEMYPNAQIIHIVRDGRDCAISMLERKRDLKIFNTYHAAYIWEKYVNAGKAFGSQHPDSYYEISYENILDEPESTLEGLCKFLQIVFNPKVVDYKKPTRSGKTLLLTKSLQKSNQAKWKQKMSKHQQFIFEANAGKTLKQCGYETLYKKKPALTNIDWLLNETHIRICFFLSRYFPIK